MTDPINLFDLRDRLRDAQFGSVDLDLDVWDAFEPPPQPLIVGTIVWFNDGPDVIEEIDTTPVYPPPLTTSIDAALMFVERHFPGWGITLENPLAREGSVYDRPLARLRNATRKIREERTDARAKTGVWAETHYAAPGTTFPLALLAAAVTAKIKEAQR